MSESTAPGTPRGALLDRNWNELLQELRVAQTGVQILTAFLLTVPFSAAFDALSEGRRMVYVGVLMAAMTSLLLLMTPVALHRSLFHRGERPWLVAAANRLSLVGLALLAVANVGAAWLVVDVVLGTPEAYAVAGLLGVLAVALWWVLPSLTRRAHRG